MKKEQKLELQQNSDSSDDNSQVSPTCPKPIVMRRMGKREKLMRMSSEIITDYKFNRNRFDLKSNLCSVIWLLAKNTKNQDDCKDIINAVCPEFFE
jgi:hypothetical protein